MSEVLLISSNEVLSHVFAIVRMASRGPPFQTPLTISHGQPQTRDSTSTHMVSHRLEVPHQFIWSAFHYATRPLPFIKTARVHHDEGQDPPDGRVPETTPRTSSSRRHRRVNDSRRLRRGLNLLIPELKYIGCAESQHKQTGLNR